MAVCCCQFLLTFLIVAKVPAVGSMLEEGVVSQHPLVDAAVGSGLPPLKLACGTSARYLFPLSHFRYPSTLSVPDIGCYPFE